MRQPFLHDLSCVLSAPVQCWSDRDGQVRPEGAQGIFCGDDRVVSELMLSVQDRDIVLDSLYEPGGDYAEYHYVVRTDEDGADPTVTLLRTRHVGDGGLVEEIIVSSSAVEPRDAIVVAHLVPDDSTMEQVRAGRRGKQLAPSSTTWNWRDADTTAVLNPGDAALDTSDPFLMTWRLTVPPRGSVTARWSLQLSDTGAPFAGPAAAPLVAPAPGGMDIHPSGAIRRLLTKAFADLNALTMASSDHPEDAFLAAGAPWFFTLFGRDSLIAARLAMPDSLSLASSTLRVLARRQGTSKDVDTAEQPGKILHEVRRATLNLDDGASLPPEYYGTIDATCLWICLFGQVHEMGMPDDEARDLLPHLRRALEWLRDHSDADGDGFIEYLDESGHGLSNQGWKDSGDSMRYADGVTGAGTVALCEVQGYAYAAAQAAATILEDLGDESDAEAVVFWRQWAADLKERFAAQFWCSDDLGRYPALALVPNPDTSEGAPTKVRLDGVSSNIGHLLGTGLVDVEDVADIVARLMHPTMFSGYGIRTLSTTNGAYWPISYHCGSVWTHDTALTIDGMLREGYDTEAQQLAQGLLRVAIGFDSRLPELFSGDDAAHVFPPRPYPAACRPQAWAAASSVVIARALGAI